MLAKVYDSSIKQNAETYEISSRVQIYAKTLSKENSRGDTAIFIHGGGSGGNHTIVERAALWLMEKGLFSRMILPDRRGAGLSSPITKMMMYDDNAKDMRALLDSMNVEGKVTAIGISYGGPIALALAGMDPRIERVILVASSPSLKTAKGLVGLLYRHNLLEPIVRLVYKRYIGRLDSDYPDFDGAYDVKTLTELKTLFLDMVKCTPRDRFESLMLENASTCNFANQSISKDIKVNVPVYRVIGDKDETWEIDIGDVYKEQIPNLKTRYIEGAGHKDVFFRADEFYEALYDMLKKEDSI